MTAIRYNEIAEILARRIVDEDYPVGSLMPTEKALMEEFNTSRHTIRAALSQLQDLGLISRRRGSGTLVQAKSPPSGFSQSLGSLEDLIDLAASSPRHMLNISTVVIDIELAQTLAIAPGSRWLRFTSLRHDAAGVALGWTAVYVDARFAKIRKAVESSPNRLISEIIEEQYGRHIVAVKQDIAARNIPGNVARALAVEPYSPGLCILRHYCDAANEQIAVSLSYHPADRYTFSTTLIRKT